MPEPQLLVQLVGPTANPQATVGIVGLSDDAVMAVGSDGDIVILNRSTILAANTALTNVLIGTPVAQAIAANSLMIANVTASGDIALYVNTGGNSQMVFWADSSTGDTAVMAASGGSVEMFVAGTRWYEFAANAATFSGAASTSNMTLKVENTSNAAAASHAVVDVTVGGTTSTGDPQLRLTVPGGISYYLGSDNSVATGDFLYVGTGTVVGDEGILGVDGRTNAAVVNWTVLRVVGTAKTSNDNAGGTYRSFAGLAATWTLAGTTTITNQGGMIEAEQLTISQSGGAVTVSKAAGVQTIAPIPTTSVTITASAGFRVLNAGAFTGTLSNQHGVYIEDMTRGTSDYGLTIEGADTACIWVSSAVDTTDAANGITFGASKDTTIYRGAAGQLNLTRSGLSVLQVEDTGTTGGAGLALQVGATSTTADPTIWFLEGTGTGAANNMSYKLYYDASANYLALESRDIDGLSADADIWRIPDGQLSIDANTTWDANVFDEYDDAALLSPYREGTINLAARREDLVRIGVLRRYPDGWVGYNDQRMAALLAGGIYQTRQRLETWTATVEERMEALEEANRILSHQLEVAGIRPEV